MEYVVKLDEKDIPVLSAALVELPYRIAAPLIDKINRQLAAKPEPSGGSEQTRPE